MLIALFQGGSAVKETIISEDELYRETMGHLSHPNISICLSLKKTSPVIEMVRHLLK